MIENIRVIVEGLPEEVQRMADALEASFPGALSWHDQGETSGSNFISVSGVGMPWFARAQGQHDGAFSNSQDRKPLAELVCGHDFEGAHEHRCANRARAHAPYGRPTMQNGMDYPHDSYGRQIRPEH